MIITLGFLPVLGFGTRVLKNRLLHGVDSFCFAAGTPVVVAGQEAAFGHTLVEGPSRDYWLACAAVAIGLGGWYVDRRRGRRKGFLAEGLTILPDGAADDSLPGDDDSPSIDDLGSDSDLAIASPSADNHPLSDEDSPSIDDRPADNPEDADDNRAEGCDVAATSEGEHCPVTAGDAFFARLSGNPPRALSSGRSCHVPPPPQPTTATAKVLDSPSSPRHTDAMVRTDTTPHGATPPNHIRRLLPKAWLAFFLTLAALCLCHGRGKETAPPASSPTIAQAGLGLPAFPVAPFAAEVQPPAAPSRLRTQPIEEIQLGQRLPGRNPIREQVETVEPNPATWRAISLHMTKPSGRGLWIELLRPAEWLAERDARVGGTVNIELLEMGAVGDAEVTAIGPCPPMAPGDGAVVTGTFKHETDAGNHVVRLGLEGQTELTAVTDNHAYWSVDRQAFVEVGSLSIGELVDTEYGFNRVVSLTPVAHTGFLYNLETTEHVYRVGSLGTLVHNSCAQFDELATWRGMIGHRNREFTLVKLEIAGHEFFGKSFGKHLDEVFPFSNINNISRFHAEGDAIGQALREGVQAGEASIFVDRALCRPCGDFNGLRNMAAELGIGRLYVFEKTGSGLSVFRIDF